MKKLTNRELLVSTKADLEAIHKGMKKRERFAIAMVGRSPFVGAIHQDAAWLERVIERLARHIPKS